MTIDHFDEMTDAERNAVQGRFWEMYGDDAPAVTVEQQRDVAVAALRTVYAEVGGLTALALWLQCKGYADVMCHALKKVREGGRLGGE